MKTRYFFWLVLTCYLLATPAKAQLVFSDDFESHAAGTTVLTPKWYAQQHCGTSPHASCRPCVTAKPQEVVTAPFYAGAKAFRMTQDKDEQWYEHGSGLCKWRNEIYNHNLFVTGEEVWVGFAFYPSKVNGLVWKEMGPNGELWNSLVVHVSQILANGSNFATALDIVQTDGSDNRYFKLSASGALIGPVQWDQWNTIVLHFVVKGTKSQEEAWVNGTHSGLKSVRLPSGQSYDLKMGVYGDRPRDKFLAYFDNYKVAKGANQYGTVNPAAGGARLAHAGNRAVSPRLPGSFRVYPNPATGGELTLEAPGLGAYATYALLDVRGKTIATGKAQNKMAIPSHYFSSLGVYLLQIRDGSRVETRRIVIGR